MNQVTILSAPEAGGQSGQTSQAGESRSGNHSAIERVRLEAAAFCAERAAGYDELARTAPAHTRGIFMAAAARLRGDRLRLLLPAPRFFRTFPTHA